MTEEVLHIIDSAMNDLKFKTSRSSGSGGQHVNKVETRVTLMWDISQIDYLTEEQTEKVVKGFHSYINKEDVISISVEESRSQLKNKETAIKRWQQILISSFKEEKKRIPTRMPKAVKAKIRKDKEHKSTLKAQRKRLDVSDFR